MVESSSFIRVNSPNVTYSETEITSNYIYQDSVVQGTTVTPTSESLIFQTSTQIGKVGLLIVGLGGNNGTTVTGGIIANRLNLEWQTKQGVQKSAYLGSLFRSTTIRVGIDSNHQPVHLPFHSLVPLVHPNDFQIGGWDISGLPLGDAMRRAQVFDWDLQTQLYQTMNEIHPWPSIYLSDWVAANQAQRADNTLEGSLQQMLQEIRKNIRDFKNQKQLDKVIVLWSANTQKFSEIKQGLNDTAENLLASISANSPEVSPSTIFAVASILEGCVYINGSPQNTFVPGATQLADFHQVLIAGDDFKSGQTKIKSVLADFLINSGLKLGSVVSYNHLGNNDGRNLSAPQTFRSKQISKSGVIQDIVGANHLLYGKTEEPDHCVVIKYVPFVGDSKRAMDEYISDIFMGGKNTIVLHNTCQDSLLAAPIIIDLAILAELCTRIRVKQADEEEFSSLHPVLSILSFLLKSPIVPPNAPVVHALFPQRYAIINLLKALVGLPPENFMLLEHKVPSLRKK